MYPETIPVLASYWLRTVCAADHNRAWWQEMRALLKRALRDEPLIGPARESLTDLRDWIEQTELPIPHDQEQSPQTEAFRDNVKREWLGPYIGRLLNEWLPAETSSLLVDADDSGIPVLASGKAIERLLVRERLSPTALQLLLATEPLSPRDVYPADLEMLHDVVLALIGETWGPPLPVLPAIVLDVAEGTCLPPDFAERVRHARVEERQGREELQVPIAAEEALKMLREGPMRIGSILVSMDGRWWEADKLLSGDRHALVFKPGGRLRIDYSADHVKMIVPFPEPKLRWSGDVHLAPPFELFGREWKAARWETDGERTWMHLVFSRVLPSPAIQRPGEMRLRRSHPAGVDMAWAALGDALAAAWAQGEGEPVEQLRRSEFIPLGRALLRFGEATARHFLPKRDAIAAELRAIRFHQSELAADYGRIPWRILPETVRTNALRRRLDPASLEIFNQVFEGLPEHFLAAA